MDTLSWFPFSIIATVLFAIATALYKLPSARQQSRFVVALWSILTSLVLAFIFFYDYLNSTTGGLILTATIWGVLFGIIFLLQMHALHHRVETNTLFPLTSVAGSALAIIAGLVIFRDSISVLQAFGLFLTTLTVFLYLYRKGKLEYTKHILVILGVTILVSFLSKIVQKIGADNYDIRPFQIYQYLGALLVVGASAFYNHKDDYKIHFTRGGVLSGLLIGLCSFFGGYAILIALTRGPFSLITGIHSLYPLGTALLAAFFFKENLTTRKIILVLLAILSIIIIRLG